MRRREEMFIRAFQCTIYFVCLRLFQSVGAFDLETCNKPLGMESGRIKDSQLSASSSFDTQSTSAINARPGAETGSGAWCPREQIHATSHEWIQVEFPGNIVISGVKTLGRWDKGRGREYAPSYMIEYWRESLGGGNASGNWARYKDKSGNEILRGNTDTSSAVIRMLDGGIVAKLVRLIPVSEATRTICLRFELLGCPYKDFLKSYSIPNGAVADDLSFRDLSYDGVTDANGTLRGGIGRLFDGVRGEDDFESDPHHWVGWRRDIHGNQISLELHFERQMNLSSISFCVSNHRSRGARLFRNARLHFADAIYSPRFIDFDLPEDVYFENARWVTIPIPHRLASRVKLELEFGNHADWLLISELGFNNQENNWFDNRKQKTTGETYFSISNDESDQNQRKKSDDNDESAFQCAMIVSVTVILAGFVLVGVLIACQIARKSLSRRKFTALASSSTSCSPPPSYRTNPSFVSSKAGTLKNANKKRYFPFSTIKTQSSSSDSSPNPAGSSEIVDIATLFTITSPSVQRKFAINVQPQQTHQPHIQSRSQHASNGLDTMSTRSSEYADPDYMTASLLHSPTSSFQRHQQENSLLLVKNNGPDSSEQLRPSPFTLRGFVANGNFVGQSSKALPAIERGRNDHFYWPVPNPNQNPLNAVERTLQR